MRFSYRDLGEQRAGSSVSVRLQGSSANVILLDEPNFRSYRARRPFRYTGGYASHSPVGLTIPHDGRWYVVADLGGYHGRVRITDADVSPPSGSAEGAEEQQIVLVRY